MFGKMILAALLAAHVLALGAAEADLRVIPYKPDPGIAVDGNPGEWSDVPTALVFDRVEQLTIGRSSWRGPDDLSGRVKLAWRGDGLYLLAEVVDDRFFQLKQDKDVWQGDHVELYLDAEPESDPGRREFGTGQFALLLSPGDLKTGFPKPQLVAVHPAGASTEKCTVAAALTDRGYVLEAFIPKELLGIPAMQQNFYCRSEAVLSDCDSEIPAQEHFMTGEPQPWRRVRPRLPPTVLGDAAGRGEKPATELKLSDELRFSAIGGEAAVTFEAPPIPEGRVAVLRLTGRLDSSKIGGYQLGAAVKLNDKLLPPEKLFNRKPAGIRRSGQSYNFMPRPGVLALAYAPDFSTVNKDGQYGLVDCSELCTFEFDIGDLLVSGKNTLLLSGSGRPELKDKTVVFAPPLLSFRMPPAVRVRRPAPTGELPLIAPKAAPEAPVFRTLEDKDGILTIRTGRSDFTVRSRFSTPDGHWHSGNAPGYFTHQRRIEPGVETLTVFDTFRNLTDKPLPLRLEYAVDFGNDLRKVYLAGLAPASKSGVTTQPGNPSTYASGVHDGIGLLPRNDVFQVHISNYARDGVAAIRDNQLVLAPGAEYTAEWMIVPVPGGDYWDFVNATRRATDANFTLPWLFTFVQTTGETNPEYLKKLAYTTSANLMVRKNLYPQYRGKSAHGTCFQEIDRSGYRKLMDNIRKYVPQAKSAIYFHCFLDALVDGDKKYPDAVLRRSDGSTAAYAGLGSMLFVPAATNSFGPAVARNVDLILDECGADGVFWDEFEYSAYPYTYTEPWDGFSGDIDRDGRLIRLKSSVTLLSQPWRMALAERIRQRGVLIINGSPATRTSAALKVQHFVETAAISNCAYAVLYSPVALGDHISERTQIDSYRWMLGALDYGCLYNWYDTVAAAYPTLTEYMFPATPVELHEGYILCRERIITKKSGLFGWNDTSRHEVHVYDENGREVPGFKAPAVVRDGKNFTELRLPEDYSAAIIRK